MELPPLKIVHRKAGHYFLYECGLLCLNTTKVCRNTKLVARRRMTNENNTITSNYQTFSENLSNLTDSSRMQIRANIVVLDDEMLELLTISLYHCFSSDPAPRRLSPWSSLF